jgi:sugar/nucleoside kinase (ribokinase family)
LLSLGAEGFVLSDGNAERTVDAEPVNGANSSGAGDALLAGYVAARLAGSDPDRAAAVAARCAALACRVSSPVSPELSPDLLGAPSKPLPIRAATVRER